MYKVWVYLWDLIQFEVCIGQRQAKCQDSHKAGTLPWNQHRGQTKLTSRWHLDTVLVLFVSKAVGTEKIYYAVTLTKNTKQSKNLFLKKLKV